MPAEHLPPLRGDLLVRWIGRQPATHPAPQPASPLAGGLDSRSPLVPSKGRLIPVPQVPVEGSIAVSRAERLTDTHPEADLRADVPRARSGAAHVPGRRSAARFLRAQRLNRGCAAPSGFVAAARPVWGEADALASDGAASGRSFASPGRRVAGGALVFPVFGVWADPLWRCQGSCAGYWPAGSGRFARGWCCCSRAPHPCPRLGWHGGRGGRPGDLGLRLALPCRCLDSSTRPWHRASESADVFRVIRDRAALASPNTLC